MNDETTNLDQADEDILNPTVSDDAIEAAAGNEIQPTYVLPCPWRTYGGCTLTGCSSPKNSSEPPINSSGKWRFGFHCLGPMFYLLHLL